MSEPFNIKEIRALLEMIEKHDVSEFQLEKGEQRLWLRRGAPEAEKVESSSIQQVFNPAPTMAGAPVAAAPAPAPVPAAAPAVAPVAPVAVSAPEPVVDETLVEITSPMVGTFYRRPAVDADSYVNEGEKIKKGTVLCIVEAMKLMNEIESEISGTVVEVCLNDAQMVEFGEVLFRVRPD